MKWSPPTDVARVDLATVDLQQFSANFYVPGEAAEMKGRALLSIPRRWRGATLEKRRSKAFLSEPGRKKIYILAICKFSTTEN